MTRAEAGELYFEDFAAGDRWEIPRFSISADEIVAFAKRWDPQPYHTDLELARSSSFGGLVASGMHTLAATTRVQHDILLGHTAAAAGIGMDSVRFRAPVRPDAALRGDIEALEVSPGIDERPWGMVIFRLRLLDEGNAPLLEVRNRVLIWNRSESESRH